MAQARPARKLGSKPIDPVTASVIQGALESIAVEMGYKLMRMSYSSIIRESEDFGAALLDAEGRQLCESRQSTPLQSGPIPGYIRGINRRFAEIGEQWNPGDVVIHNHSYYGASHQPDGGFIIPIFWEGQLVGFSATTAQIGAHGHVLTPGRYVGAEEVEDDGDPFEEKMPRLVAELHAQFAESAKLEQAIKANLRGLGYGG